MTNLSEAYLSVYEEKNDSYLETDMNKRRKNNEKAIEDMKKTDAHKDMIATVRNKFNEEVDLFDYLLEYLVAEGYADTNASAIAIMANMSEEWRLEILDEAAKDQSDKQIDKGVKSTYKAGNVLDNQHQGRSKGLNKLSATERAAKEKRMRDRLKNRRDDLFKERGGRDDAKREQLKKLLGL